MKKYFTIILSFIFMLVLILHSLIFTNTGNNIIAKYIEDEINYGQDRLLFKINNLKLSYSSISFNAWISDNSEIKVFGNFSIFKQEFDLQYFANINDLSIFKNLANYNIKGSLETNGTFVGNKHEAVVQGVSNIAKSDSRYYFNLKDFKPKSLNIQIKNAKIEEILLLLGKPIYAKGDINILADIRNTNKENLEGMIISNILDGKINNDIVNKELKVASVNSINFRGNLIASLLPNKIDIKSELTSSMIDIFLDKTSIDFETNKINSIYKIDVKNLATLSTFLNKKWVGEFSTNGNLELFNDICTINGQGNIFQSNTKYIITFDKEKLSAIDFTVENGKIEKLLKMLTEPIYATGDLEIKGKVSDLNSEKIKGSINSKLSNILIVNEVTNTVFNLDIKNQIKTNLQADTTISDNKAISKINVDSNIGSLITQNSILNFNDNSFSSDYSFIIPNLEKVKDFTKLKLIGKAKLDGKFYTKKGKYTLNGKSNIANGILNLDLKDGNLKISLDDISTKELSYLLDYPKIFDSNADVNFNYNFTNNSGNMNAKLQNGHFISNGYTALINTVTKNDLTKETFERASINGQIKDKILTANLNMKSQNNQISIKDSVVNFNKNTIDMKVNTNTKGNPLNVSVKGEIEKPKFTLDTK